MNNPKQPKGMEGVPYVEVMGIALAVAVKDMGNDNNPHLQAYCSHIPERYRGFFKSNLYHDNITNLLKRLAVGIIAHDMTVAFMPLTVDGDWQGDKWTVELGELWEGSDHDNIVEIAPCYTFGARSVDCTFYVTVKPSRDSRVIHKSFTTKTISEAVMVLAETWGVIEQKIPLPIPLKYELVSNLEVGDCFTYNGSNDKTKLGCLVYKGETNSMVVDYPPIGLPIKEYLIENKRHATLLGRNIKAFLPFAFKVRVRVTRNEGETVDTHTFKVNHMTTYEANNTAYMVALGLGGIMHGQVQVDVLGLLGEVIHSVNTTKPHDGTTFSSNSVKDAADIIYQCCYSMFV